MGCFKAIVNNSESSSNNCTLYLVVPFIITGSVLARLFSGGAAPLGFYIAPLGYYNFYCIPYDFSNFVWSRAIMINNLDLYQLLLSCYSTFDLQTTVDVNHIHIEWKQTHCYYVSWLLIGLQILARTLITGILSSLSASRLLLSSVERFGYTKYQQILL